MLTINKHLADYEDFNGKIIKKDGVSYRVHISLRRVAYPYERMEWRGELEEINCPHPYGFTDLSDPETFANYQPYLK